MANCNELWKQLTDASDELLSAFLAYVEDQTIDHRTRFELSARRYNDSLEPVVGVAAAFEFAAAFQRVTDSMDRRMRLLAEFATHGEMDRADTEFARSLELQTDEALRAFAAAKGVSQKHLDDVV